MCHCGLHLALLPPFGPCTVQSATHLTFLLNVWFVLQPSSPSKSRYMHMRQITRKQKIVVEERKGGAELRA